MTPYYEDDLVTLYHGDCREVTEWLAADVLVTDPPYGIAYRSGEMSRAKAPRLDSIHGDDDTAPRDAALATWGNRPAVVFGTWRRPRPHRKITHRLIWHKAKSAPAFTRGAFYSAEEEIYLLGNGWMGDPIQNVLVTQEQQSGHGLVEQTGHPTPKPVSLMGRLIAKCPPGVIADPFAGSGSTLIAAKMLSRRAVGVEIDESYCEIAAYRLAQDVLDFGGAA